ncbi:2-hydroxyacylsphingosine 1-beta-galactosyltransferase-like 3 [Homarus americanus]|uniref:UDP-glucuronosyltransferase n=1 Tax=Homarus americanus TaxID=6706 RepID=A0A8J5JVY8_HOMAM|nr:2-hydroxyacylsphingosine 1-beta-galactosyltransferase-like 3 [Homarus americanus]
MMKLLVVWLTLLVVLSEGSRVLMVLPLGSPSHKNLDAAGRVAGSHHYTDLVASEAWETIRKVTGSFDVFKMREASGGKNINSEVMKKVIRNLPEYCDAFLRDPGVRSAWHTKPDVVILPAFMNECGLALVHKFKVPFIYITTSGLTPWTADLLANPENPAYVPNQYLSYGANMNLWERTVNTLVRIISPYLRSQLVMKRVEGVVQRFLGDPTVSLTEVEKNVSLVLVNSHYSLGHPRPLMPNVVEVGAMHCRPARPLQDAQLRHFLDSSTVPVVVFSLGSTIRSQQLPLWLRQSVLAAFARLPYRVLWKWEGAAIPDLPPNVITSAWLPQQDVLGHERVRAFVTHGGLLSLQEAVYHNVPIVGLPLMSDQHLNVRQAVTLGLGRQLTLETLTEDNLYEAITAVVEDDQYRGRVKQTSTLLRDQETPPLQRAVYWTEHVLRHGGAPHLRSPAANMPLHQYFLLDVAAVLAVAAAVLVLLLWWTTRAVTRALTRALRKAATSLLTLVRSHVKLE